VSRVATPAFPVTPGHEVPGARRLVRLVKELPVRAGGLKAVMFDQDGLSNQQRNKQGQKSWPCQMNQFCLPHAPPHLKETRPAHQRERR
jgi:hypothetical protein